MSFIQALTVSGSLLIFVFVIGWADACIRKRPAKYYKEETNVFS